MAPQRAEVYCRFCPTERPGQAAKLAVRGKTAASIYPPYCASCKTVALGQKERRQPPPARQGGDNDSEDEDEEDEEDEVSGPADGEAAAGATGGAGGGERHMPPAAPPQAAPAPAPAPARPDPPRRPEARHAQPAGQQRPARMGPQQPQVNINSRALANAAAAAFALPGVAAPANLANMVATAAAAAAAAATGAIATSLQHEVIGPARRERGLSLYQALRPALPPPRPAHVRAAH